MGATRKLASLVAVGLMVLSSLFVVYFANEPNRRDDRTTNQHDTSVERGTQLYITYCLRCHGPQGLGSAEKDADGNGMGRIGLPLNQKAVMTEEQRAQAKADFQSDDPVKQAQAEEFLRFRIMYGAPAEGQLYQTYTDAPVMPAFRKDLNVEEVNELVYLIMHGDWNYVYNTSVHQTGKAEVEAQCASTESTPAPEIAEYCDHPDNAPAMYPTVPPTVAPEGEGGEATPAAAASPAAGDSGDASNGGQKIDVSAEDSLKFSETAITAKPGDTIVLTNNGFMTHDLVVDELGMKGEVKAQGDTVEIQIPADAKPGDYEFYCSVAGHKEGGMKGTLTIQAP